MVDVKARRCKHEGCHKYPSFGEPGSKGSYCYDHKAEGMLSVRTKYKPCDRML